MAIGTSAPIAIIFGEDDGDLYDAAIENDPVRLISAATSLETSLVLEGRYGEAGGRELDLLVYRIALQVVALTFEHVELAHRGFRKFGKGKHPAALNFRRLLRVHALKATGEPLLAKGADFRRTDLLLVALEPKAGD